MVLASRPYAVFSLAMPNPTRSHMAVRGTVTDAHAVCHGCRSPLQQTSRGCSVSGVDLVVTTVNVNDYERPFLHVTNLGLYQLLIYGFPPGRYLAWAVCAVCHSIILLVSHVRGPRASTPSSLRSGPVVCASRPPGGGWRRRFLSLWASPRRSGERGTCCRG